MRFRQEMSRGEVERAVANSETMGGVRTRKEAERWEMAVRASETLWGR